MAGLVLGLRFLACLHFSVAAVGGFAVNRGLSRTAPKMTASPSSGGGGGGGGGGEKELYGIPGSGWSSPTWNWGSGIGTGHDCAHICRQRFATRARRSEFVKDLMNSGEGTVINFEEVKLVLGLAWQRGQWDGSDGGPGGYSEVLATMAEARRYESGEDCEKLLVADMKERYELLDPTPEDLAAMESLTTTMEENVHAAKLKCAGLVLKSMGFIERGL